MSLQVQPPTRSKCFARAALLWLWLCHEQVLDPAPWLLFCTVNLPNVSASVPEVKQPKCKDSWSHSTYTHADAMPLAWAAEMCRLLGTALLGGLADTLQRTGRLTKNEDVVEDCWGEETPSSEPWCGSTRLWGPTPFNCYPSLAGSKKEAENASDSTLFTGG